MTSSGVLTFDDESLRSWKLLWSGHKRKPVYGVGELVAPHEKKLVNHQGHLPANISVEMTRLAVLNV